MTFSADAAAKHLTVNINLFSGNRTNFGGSPDRKFNITIPGNITIFSGNTTQTNFGGRR